VSWRGILGGPGRRQFATDNVLVLTSKTAGDSWLILLSREGDLRLPSNLKESCLCDKLTTVAVKFSSYRSVNTLHLGYKNQSVNAVQWNNRCFFLRSTQNT